MTLQGGYTHETELVARARTGSVRVVDRAVVRYDDRFLIVDNESIERERNVAELKVPLKITMQPLGWAIFGAVLANLLVWGALGVVLIVMLLRYMGS